MAAAFAPIAPSSCMDTSLYALRSAASVLEGEGEKKEEKKGNRVQ